MLGVKCAILISATSGIRAEELYKLRTEDTDFENRIVYIRVEIAKDYKDRITFFNLETQRALYDHIDAIDDTHYFFLKNL